MKRLREWLRRVWRGFGTRDDDPADVYDWHVSDPDLLLPKLGHVHLVDSDEWHWLGR